MSFEPFMVIDVYVPVSLPRNVFQSVHWVDGVTPVVKLSVNVIAVVHAPLLHTGDPLPQTLPHEPQFEGSLRTSMHEVPQNACPVGQQLPFVHHCVSATHAVVQAPQRSWKFWRS